MGREEGAELKLIETLGWSEGAAKKAKEKVGNTVHAVEAKAGEGKTGIDTKIEQANHGLQRRRHKSQTINVSNDAT